MSCPGIATNLTRNYETAESFHGGSISEFFVANGVLLTMCLPGMLLRKSFPCSLTDRQDHVAASWVRKKDTGFRIFDVPDVDDIWRPDIGLILDPAISNITCLYPVDGGTDGRNQKGCGTFMDPTKNQNWLLRLFREYWKARLVAFKILEFGAKPWSEIDCMTFLDKLQADIPSLAFHDNSIPLLEISDCPATTSGKSALKALSSEVLSLLNLANLVGHEVCDMEHTLPPPKFTPHDWYIYVGKCSWKPTELNHMLFTMDQLISDHPDVKFWNEVVVERPQRLENIVKAVFVMNNSSNFDQAKSEARRLGKPLLVATVDRNGNLTFTCQKSPVSLPPQQQLSKLRVAE